MVIDLLPICILLMQINHQIVNIVLNGQVKSFGDSF
jgi:hypothetical protein